VFRPDQDPVRLDRRLVLGLLAAAFLVRLAWGLTRPSDPAALAALPDQREYLDAARSLLAGDGLAFGDPRFGGGPVRAFRAPGYPLFVAAGGAVPGVVRAAQALLDTSTVLAAILIARRWLPPWTALLAGATVAADPLLVAFCGLLLSETLFTAMLAWGVAMLAHGASPLAPAARRRARWLWWGGAALLCASVHVRPSAVALPIVVGVAAAWAGVGSRRGVRRFPLVTVLALLVGLTLLPWAVRNRAVLGRWVWTTTNAGFTLYDGLNPDAPAADWRSRGGSDQRWAAGLPLLGGLGEVERSDYLSSLAWAWAREHPGAAVGLVPYKVLRTWSPVPLSAEYGSRPTDVAVAAAHGVPLLVLAIVGLLRRSLPGRAKLLLIAPAVLFTLAHAATVGSLRYRLPLHPLLAVVAASALVPHGDAVVRSKSRTEG